MTTAKTIGFRPTEDDTRTLAQLAEQGVSTTDAIRRGLRLLAHERWLANARIEALALRDENLNDEPDAW